jgi:hypothetical protein
MTCLSFEKIQQTGYKANTDCTNLNWTEHVLLENKTIDYMYAANDECILQSERQDSTLVQK